MLSPDGNGGESCGNVTALAATKAKNYPQVLITVALFLTTTAPYSHSPLPPCSQYLEALKLGMMSSWRTAVVVAYSGKVRAAAY